MSDIELTPDQIAFALHTSKKLSKTGYILVPFGIFGEYFGPEQRNQLAFILSTNAWKIKADDVLELVAFSYDMAIEPTYPIEDLNRQLKDMKRRGVSEEDRNK